MERIEGLLENAALCRKRAGAAKNAEVQRQYQDLERQWTALAQAVMKLAKATA